MRHKIAVAVLGALMLVVGLTWYASAQSPKHFACYSGNPQPTRNLWYLPNGADPCPPGWTKIDWVDD